MKRLLCLIGFVALMAGSGCDSIPREALNAYVSAFNEARTAGELLTADFAAAKAEFERRDAAGKPAAPAPVAPAIPMIYVPPPSAAEPPTATEARLLTWEAISLYNAALAALSVGESEEKLKATTERLGQTIGRLANAAGRSIPGLDKIIPAAELFLKEFEAARRSGEFARAIAAGGPPIRSMLAVMIDDVSDHYRLRAALANEDLTDLDDDAKIERARIMDAIAELRTTMDQFVILARKCDAALAKLQASPRTPVDFTAQTNEMLALAITLKGHWQAYKAARIEGAK